MQRGRDNGALPGPSVVVEHPMAQLTAEPEIARPEAVRARRKEDSIFGMFPASWIYLLPAMIFFIGWQLYPIARVAWLSFTDYYFLRDVHANWIGLDNYREAFADHAGAQWPAPRRRVHRDFPARHDLPPDVPGGDGRPIPKPEDLPRSCASCCSFRP